jgi:hypothetical protein
MSGTQFDPAVVQALVQLWHAGELADPAVWMGQKPDARDILDVPTSLTAPVPRSSPPAG